VAVEDQLVLPADGVAECDEADVVPRASNEHLFTLAVLAEVERRGREIDDELRSGEGEICGRRARLPHVLADRDPDEDLAEANCDEVVPRGEIPVLVEHAVIRQEALPVDSLHLSVGADGAGVEKVGREVGRADERNEAARLARDLLERTPRGPDEAGPEQEVLRGIPGDRQLREEHKLGACLARVFELIEDGLAVALQVPDHGVDLGQRDPHTASLSSFRPWG
jgi:hypothetical protein